jgi:hypothetical protein
MPRYNAGTSPAYALTILRTYRITAIIAVHGRHQNVTDFGFFAVGVADIREEALATSLGIVLIEGAAFFDRLSVRSFAFSSRVTSLVRRLRAWKSSSSAPASRAPTVTIPRNEVEVGARPDEPVKLGKEVHDTKTGNARRTRHGRRAHRAILYEMVVLLAHFAAASIRIKAIHIFGTCAGEMALLRAYEAVGKW